MKKYAPHILILAVGVVSLALMAPSASAQSWCQHLHQLSKKINGQINDQKKCDFCTREKMEVYYIKHKIRGSILQDCDCDETDDEQCDTSHGHAVSDNGDWEYRDCVFTDPSEGIPGNSEFTATIKRWVKYCKDLADNPGYAWPRAGYHNGSWKITSGLDGAKLASGSLEGCDGVDPSFERWYTTGVGSARAHHTVLPGNVATDMGPDFCQSGDPNNRREYGDCYLPGWTVGCLTGKTTTTYVERTCPPTNSIPDSTDSTTWEKWKVKACYSGGFVIDPTEAPCDQYTGNPDWFLRLEGVMAIKAP